jgi:lipoprotein-releasing system ATP-binding protein
MSLVSCRNLHKTFRRDTGRDSELHVLKGIDLDIAPGEMIAIIGASGSGKSTLLHLLGGLDTPTEGSVLWEGRDIGECPEEELAKLRGSTVGFVFQFHHLLPEFSALENVMIPQMIVGKNRTVAEEHARELLGIVGLSDRCEHKPGELSGGEQQRIAVARALANSPKIIFADEPTGNLDSVTSRQLFDLLHHLNNTQHQAFVIVTHSEQLAGEADRVFRMADGNLVPNTA